MEYSYCHAPVMLATNYLCNIHNMYFGMKIYEIYFLNNALLMGHPIRMTKLIQVEYSM